MSDQFLGEIRPFANNFAPRGWLQCNGQILPISRYTALFSLLGTMYGGNGSTTFGIPNIGGTTLYNAGQGPGLQDYVQGENGGADAITIITSDMPAHNHTFTADNAPVAIERGSETNAPAANVSFLANGFAKSTSVGNGAVNTFVTTAPNTTMAPNMISPAGGGQAHENRAPFLTISYYIALEGVFPARN
ncbi:hypothetical protein BEL04_02145 [Mucilaginibacter sp. PPCGB 2223]|uniref:phage tail protein n=1 Tax=Mucilaginibacter sp. PPCGB 2223 TaxID=1886027 RepID=UPI000824C096|nr:tail fiber protein [Mucilaginibacter sp. PPCGB 2223]OCX53138.1 hypothetical protein BEL04_02145 [Mucilaginibacter sp. PPCGB 2223]